VRDLRRFVEWLATLILLAVPFLIGLRAINLLEDVYGTHGDLHPVLASEALFWSIPVLSLLASVAIWGQVWRRWGIGWSAPLVGAVLGGTGGWWVAFVLWRIVRGLAASAPDSGGPSARFQLQAGLVFGIPAALVSVVCASILSRRALQGSRLWRLSFAGLGLAAVTLLPTVELTLTRLDLSSALRRLRRSGEDGDSVWHICAVCSVLAKWPVNLDAVVPDLEKMWREDPERAAEVSSALSCFSLRDRLAARRALSSMATAGSLPAQVRAAAVMESDLLNEEERLEALLRDESPDVRRAVVELVHKKLQEIDRWQKTPEWVRKGSPSAERLEDTGFVVLQIAKRDQEPVVRGAALVMLGKLGDANAYVEAAAMARAADRPTCARAFRPDDALGSENAGYDRVLEAVVANPNCNEIAEAARAELGARAKATSFRHALSAKDEICHAVTHPNEALAVVRRIARESPQDARIMVANLNCAGHPQILREVSRALDLPPEVRLAASSGAAGPPLDLVLLFLEDKDTGLRRHAIDSLIDGFGGTGPMASREEKQKLWGLRVLQERGLKDPAETNRRAICIGLEHSLVPHEAEVVRLKEAIHEQCRSMGLLP
jgi:hypothetical protein